MFRILIYNGASPLIFIDLNHIIIIIFLMEAEPTGFELTADSFELKIKVSHEGLALQAVSWENGKTFEAVYSYDTLDEKIRGYFDSLQELFEEFYQSKDRAGALEVSEAGALIFNYLVNKKVKKLTFNLMAK